MTTKEEIKGMIERMRLAYGVSKKELPRIFGCKENTINNWAYFRRIPHEQLVQCRKHTGRSMEWLMYGAESPTSPSARMEDDLSHIIHRTIEDGIDFGAIVEHNKSSAKSVANKIHKEILKYLRTNEKPQKGGVRASKS